MPSTQQRTEDRLVAGVVVAYQQTALDARGEPVTRSRSAMRGETISLTRDEEVRLDALGMLAEPGQTLADVERAIARNREGYQAARQSVSPETAAIQ